MHAERDTPGSFTLLGTRVDACSYEQLTTTVLRWVDQKQRQHYCCFTNPHSIVLASRDPVFREATNHGSLVLADGSGVVLASRLLRKPVRNRVTGPTSMLRVMEAGLATGLRHYLFGATAETLQRLSDALRTRLPQLQIVGAHSPGFAPVEQLAAEEGIRDINEANPDILWVGLGAPKQEKWIHRFRSQVRAPVLMAVGAAFDYHAGTVPWAPAWVRRIGFEWAYRLCRQPRTQLRRNLNSAVFVRRVIMDHLLKPSSREQPHA